MAKVELRNVRKSYGTLEVIHGVDARRLLRQSILSETALPLEQVLYVCERVAAALHHAHTAKDLSGRSLNVVHRDVSPSNIILGFDGQVKLLDFGVASAAVGETFDGLIGKFSYMSPEQLRSSKDVDHRTDIWALGVILFRLTTGQYPFHASSMPALVVAVASEPPDAKASERLARPLLEVVQRCLEKDPALRPPSAAALRARLEACRVSPWSAEDARRWWSEHQAALEPSPVPSASGPKTIAVRGAHQTAS